VSGWIANKDDACFAELKCILAWFREWHSEVTTSAGLSGDDLESWQKESPAQRSCRFLPYQTWFDMNVSIETFCGLFTDFLVENPDQTVTPRNVSQDCVECHFSMQRGVRGHEKNPSGASYAHNNSIFRMIGNTSYKELSSKSASINTLGCNVESGGDMSMEQLKCVRKTKLQPRWQTELEDLPTSTPAPAPPLAQAQTPAEECALKIVREVSRDCFISQNLEWAAILTAVEEDIGVTSVFLEYVRADLETLHPTAIGELPLATKSDVRKLNAARRGAWSKIQAARVGCLEGFSSWEEQWRLLLDEVMPGEEARQRTAPSAREREWAAAERSVLQFILSASIAAHMLFVRASSSLNMAGKQTAEITMHAMNAEEEKHLANMAGWAIYKVHSRTEKLKGGSHSKGKAGALEVLRELFQQNSKHRTVRVHAPVHGFMLKLERILETKYLNWRGLQNSKGDIICSTVESLSVDRDLREAWCVVMFGNLKLCGKDATGTTQTFKESSTKRKASIVHVLQLFIEQYMLSRQKTFLTVLGMTTSSSDLALRESLKQSNKKPKLSKKNTIRDLFRAAVVELRDASEVEIKGYDADKKERVTKLILDCHQYENEYMMSPQSGFTAAAMNKAAALVSKVIKTKYSRLDRLSILLAALRGDHDYEVDGGAEEAAADSGDDDVTDMEMDMGTDANAGAGEGTGGINMNITNGSESGPDGDININISTEQQQEQQTQTNTEAATNDTGNPPVEEQESDQSDNFCMICGEEGDGAYLCGNSTCNMICHEECLPIGFETPDQYGNTHDDEDPEWQCPCCSLRDKVKGERPFVTVPYATQQNGSTRYNTVEYDVMLLKKVEHDGTEWYGICQVYERSKDRGSNPNVHVQTVSLSDQKVPMRLMDGPLPSARRSYIHSVSSNQSSRNVVELGSDDITFIGDARTKRMPGLLSVERLEDEREKAEEETRKRKAVEQFIT
jgi:hypothetical protein